MLNLNENPTVVFELYHQTSEKVFILIYNNKILLISCFFYSLVSQIQIVLRNKASSLQMITKAVPLETQRHYTRKIKQKWNREISMINVRHLASEFLFQIQCGARLNLVKAMLSPFKWYYEESVLRYAILALIKMRCLITQHAEHSRLRPFFTL